MAKTITNEKQLYAYLNSLSTQLLRYVSNKVVALMKRNLRKGASISTTSMQEGVTYELDKNSKSSTIYIDYDFVSDIFARPPEIQNNKLVEWGHFTNTFGSYIGAETWRGELISFRMAEWLEYGGNGDIGNQPIRANHWYTQTVQEVRANINSWVKEFLKKKLG